MSSKSAHRIRKIQSLANRGDWKKAYKEAAFLAKQQPSDPEVQSFLVSCLWGWIKDSVRKNQFEEAKSNVTELLRHSNIPKDIQSEFPPVFRTLGLNSLLPKELQQDMSDPKIQAELVDRFLVSGAKSGDLLPETLADAERIQNAFQLIETKNDVEALNLTKSISFRSPVSDWRLFIRGLVDHYQGDSEKAAESWRRLAPERPPARIAAKLQNLLHEQAKVDVKKQGSISRLFSLFRAQGGSESSRKPELLDTLRMIDDYLQQGKYKELVGRFHASKKLFQDTMPIQYDRLQRIVLEHILKNASPAIVRQFIDRNLPLPMDPRGNRSLAIYSDLLEDNTQFNHPNWLLDSQVYWKTFAEKDIDLIESFSPKMKQRAKAAVYDFMASRVRQEFTELLDELDLYPDEIEEMEEEFGFSRSIREVESLLEKAMTSDPTFPDPYHHLMAFFLMTLPEEEQNIPFHDRIAEINKRMLKHIPEDKKALFYLFEYHHNADELDEAKPYYEKLREIDPLSRDTQFRRYRFLFARIRKGLRNSNFPAVDAAIAELKSGPSLETMLCRYDLIPLALEYINDVLQKKGDSMNKYFAAAKELGYVKKMPLLMAVLFEGQELGLPKQLIDSLKAEWNEAVAGRCNGNAAGALADLAFNYRLLASRFPKGQDLSNDAYAYINRAGQVKWNNEKDLFGATHLLWLLAVENRTEAYEKTFQNLVKKGVKQYPKSLFFLFFNAETLSLEPRWKQIRERKETLEDYQEFLRRVGIARNDPEYYSFVTKTEYRINELSQMDASPFPFPFGGMPFYNHDDDDDDYDDDNEYGSIPSGGPAGIFDMIGDLLNLPPGMEISLEEQKEIRANGGFTPAIRKRLENSVPRQLGLIRKEMIDAFEECILKGLPMDRFGLILRGKLKNMSPVQQMAFLASLMSSSDFGGLDDDDFDDDDDDDDYLPGFRPESGKKKNQKKKNKKKKR